MLLTFPVKVLLYSGIYGALMEITSGQEMVLTYQLFKKNAKSFWKIYLGLSLLPVFILISLKTLLSGTPNAFLLFVSSCFDLIIFYILVRFIIHRKYPNFFNNQEKKIVDVREMCILAVLYVIYMALLNLPRFIEMEIYSPLRITGVLAKYMHFLIFLYFCFITLHRFPKIKEKFNYEKELFLINPLGGDVMSSIFSLVIRSYPPIFVVLKALTPKAYRTKEFNRVTWRERYYKSNKLVCITSYSCNSAEAYKIAKAYKRHGSTVIMGGPHVSFLADEALEYCDSVVIGEAEGIWKEVMRDYENNSLKRKYVGGATEDFYEEVHQELLNSPPWVIKEFLESSRGCKFWCDFCTISPLSEGKVRTKPVHQIVELIEKAKSQYKHFVFSFLDNNIYNNPAYARALFQALKPLKIRWMAHSTIDIAKNEETLRLAKESGCFALAIGYEIIGDSPEKRRGGKLAMAEKYKQFTQRIKKAGILIKANFIFGFDSDSLKNLLSIWRFSLSLLPLWACLSFRTPLPGTKLYYEMLRENRLTNLNWRNYAALDLVFRHERLNNSFVLRFFPLISILFLFTTSLGGYILFYLLILVALMVSSPF